MSSKTLSLKSDPNDSNSRNCRSRLPTGDPQIDGFLNGGLSPGIYQILGLPGVGKSQFLRGVVETNHQQSQSESSYSESDPEQNSEQKRFKSLYIDVDGGQRIFGSSNSSQVQYQSESTNVNKLHRVNTYSELLAVLELYEKRSRKRIITNTFGVQKEVDIDDTDYFQKEKDNSIDSIDFDQAIKVSAPVVENPYFDLLIIDSIASILRMPYQNTNVNAWKIIRLVKRLSVTGIIVNHLTFAQPVKVVRMENLCNNYNINDDIENGQSDHQNSQNLNMIEYLKQQKGVSLPFGPKLRHYYQLKAIAGIHSSNDSNLLQLQAYGKSDSAKDLDSPDFQTESTQHVNETSNLNYDLSKFQQQYNRSDFLNQKQSGLSKFKTVGKRVRQSDSESETYLGNQTSEEKILSLCDGSVTDSGLEPSFNQNDPTGNTFKTVTVSGLEYNHNTNNVNFKRCKTTQQQLSVSNCNNQIHSAFDDDLFSDAESDSDANEVSDDDNLKFTKNNIEPMRSESSVESNSLQNDYALRPALGQYFSHLADHTLVLTPTELTILKSINRI